MTSVTSAGTVHLGMDTSKDTIVVAVLLPGEELPAMDRVVNREEAVRRLIGRFGDRGRLRACYEAGPGGYDLHRLLASMGVACDVVAPSLIPKGGSDRVKTDKRDAARLARLHRAGELTPVRVPAPAEEAVRDLARVRAAVLADRKRAQQRLTAMLMRHGRIWREGSYWSKPHRAWIAARCERTACGERISQVSFASMRPAAAVGSGRGRPRDHGIGCCWWPTECSAPEGI
jgi:transposase